MSSKGHFDLDTILAEDDRVEPPARVKGKTSKFLTRYEYCAVIYTRAKQLEAGATPLIEPDGEYDPIRLAEIEMAARVIPLIIVRTLPTGKKEILKVKDMHIRDY